MLNFKLRNSQFKQRNVDVKIVPGQMLPRQFSPVEKKGVLTKLLIKVGQNQINKS